MSAVHYCVEAADLHAHLFKVTLTLDQPAARQTVSLPVWIPGSYLVREFSKNLQNLVATQGRKKNRHHPTRQMHLGYGLQARPSPGAELRGVCL